MVKALLDTDTLLEKAESAFSTGKRLVREQVIGSVQDFFITVNGQKVLNDVREYMTENDLINTALVTRLVQAESQICSLQASVTRLSQVESQIRWLQRLIGLMIALLIVAEAVHWLLR
jgi:hypothetical protein